MTPSAIQSFRRPPSIFQTSSLIPMWQWSSPSSPITVRKLRWLPRSCSTGNQIQKMSMEKKPVQHATQGSGSRRSMCNSFFIQHTLLSAQAENGLFGVTAALELIFKSKQQCVLCLLHAVCMWNLNYFVICGENMSISSIQWSCTPACSRSDM